MAFSTAEPLLLVPCTAAAGREGSWRLTVLSEAKVALEVRAPALSAAARVLAPALLGTSCVDPVARWQAVPEGCTRLAQGRWQGANAGGSHLEASWGFNPQFALRFEEDSRLAEDKKAAAAAAYRRATESGESREDAMTAARAAGRAVEASGGDGGGMLNLRVVITRPEAAWAAAAKGQPVESMMGEGPRAPLASGPQAPPPHTLSAARWQDCTSLRPRLSTDATWAASCWPWTMPRSRCGGAAPGTRRGVRHAGRMGGRRPRLRRA